MQFLNQPYLTFENQSLKSIKERKNKVFIKDFALPNSENLLNSLSNISMGKDFKEIISKLKSTNNVSISMGAHVIKTGNSPFIIELIKQKRIKSISLNGAGLVHDLEIAYIGETSENVEESIQDGSFGMCEETLKMIYKIGGLSSLLDFGLGETSGYFIDDKNLEFKEYSIIYNCYKHKIPCTIHLAFGNDIFNLYKDFNGEMMGRATHRDFQIFCKRISELNNGIYFNIGSAVLLPEVFLKAISICRNLEYNLDNITTINMDFINSYRSLNNIVKRPGIGNEGKGYNLIGYHEIMIPLLYFLWIN